MVVIPWCHSYPLVGHEQLLERVSDRFSEHQPCLWIWNHILKALRCLFLCLKRNERKDRICWGYPKATFLSALIFPSIFKCTVHGDAVSHVLWTLQLEKEEEWRDHDPMGDIVYYRVLVRWVWATRKFQSQSILWMGRNFPLHFWVLWDVLVITWTQDRLTRENAQI